MKKVVLSIIVALMLGSGVYYFVSAHAEKPITNYPGQGKTIVAFGDSLVQGVGASSRESNFVALLSTKLGTKIINEGIGGNTTRDGLARIDAVLAKHDPKLVIVLLGGNDALRNIPQQETFNNLDTIIQKIHNSGAMLLLLGIQGGLLHDPYKDQFELLAEKHNTAYVESVLSGLLGKKEYMFDTIHPNDNGYKILADKVFPELEKLNK
jgi:acyl-CoA thioesterase I